jgi:GNAT superfamily N-acetyltransferase
MENWNYNGYTIRRGWAQDTETCFMIAKTIGEIDTPENFSKQAFRRDYVLVVERDEGVVGYCQFRLYMGEGISGGKIVALKLLPTHHGQGLTEFLIQIVETKAHRLGLTRLQLADESVSDIHRTINGYENWKQVAGRMYGN